MKMNTTEFSGSGKFESPEHHTELIDGAEAIIRNYEDTSRIDEEDFTDLYGAEEIKKDLKENEKLEGIFNEKEKELGEEDTSRKKIVSAMENVIAVYGDQFGWFGNATIKRASKYDDYHNGIDEIIEYDSEDEKDKRYMGLGVDAILSASPSCIREKITKNLQCVLDDNKLGKEIKYYENQDGEKMKLEHVVPVVVGLDGQHAKRMFDQVLKYMDTKIRREKYPGPGSDFDHENSVKNMIENPAQKVFIEQINMQLSYYLQILEGRKNDDKVKDFYSNIEDMKDSLDQVLEDSNAEDIWSDDKASAGMKKVLNDLKRT